MRSLPPILVVLAAVSACEQRFSATPSTDSLPRPSLADAGEAWLNPSVADGGAGAQGWASSHALSIVSCAWSGADCPAGDPDASVTASYRVVFASGRSVLRSREQAMSDLYRELRDRTTSGEHLVARPVTPGDGGAPGRPKATSTVGSSTSSDALAQSALRLVDLVDSAGEVSIDVVRGARQDCILSIGRPDGDAGASSCLIKEPERPPSRGRGGISF
jgi:hypothetical protein